MRYILEYFTHPITQRAQGKSTGDQIEQIKKLADK